jgi:hypothetical protein
MIANKILFKKIIKKVLNGILEKIGLRVTRIPINHNRSGLNLNVGCGSYEIHGFISLDFFTTHYYKHLKKFTRVNYDMRKDSLPYFNDSVDAIYCSHVIEHIETSHVNFFLRNHTEF